MKLLMTMNLPYTRVSGGTNRSNRSLAEGLAERQHTVRVVVPALATPSPITHKQFLDELTSNGINVSANGKVCIFNLNGVEVHAVAEPSLMRGYLISQANEFEPDWTLVSSEDPSQNLLDAALKACPGKVVYLAHTPQMFPFGPASLYPGNARTELVGQAAAIVAISKFVAGYIHEWTGFETFVNHPPHFGAGPFPSYKHFDRGHVLMMNASAVKGISIFLDLARSLPDIKFAALPGYGTTAADRAALSDLPNVTILKNRRNIDELLCDASVLLMPSLWVEGFGMAVVDAMVRGIPVLASNFSGLVEAKLGTDYLLPVRPIECFEDRLDDSMLPAPIVPDQDINPWRNALVDLFSNHELYARQSASSRDAAMKFVSNLSVAPLEDFLNKLGSSNGSKHKQALRQSNGKTGQNNGSSGTNKNNMSDNVTTLTPEQLALLVLRNRKKNLKSQEKQDQQTTIKRAPRDRVLPLSFAQQRLWFFDQLQPGRTAYNMPNALRLEGQLNVEALEQALSEVLRRHEILRTTFAVVDGQPAPVISQPQPMQLHINDISGLPEPEREAKARQLADEEAQRPFKLSEGPLLRCGLLRLAQEHHILLLTIHHIVSDGWSMGVLVKEMATLYKAYSEGQPSSLEELEIQYADYAVWQREYLRGEVLERQVEYWRKQLQGAPPLLELPTDRPRPAVQTYRGSRLALSLPPDLSDGLRSLSRAEGVTLFMTMLAAFQALLSRFSGQSDILVSTGIANRTRRETESLIGFFVNTLVLRSDLSGNPSFRELLKQVREVTLAAYAHQDLPFEVVVEALQPERNTSYTPIFQVMMVLQNAPQRVEKVAGIELRGIEGEQTTAKFDLTLFVEEQGREMVCWMEYNTDLFNLSTIQQMLGCYEEMLEEVIKQPDRELEAMPMISHQQREQLKRAVDIGPHQPNILEMLARTVKAFGQRAALSCGGREISYEELDEKSNRLANKLLMSGARKASVVAIMAEDVTEVIAGIIGTLKAGCAFMALERGQPVRRLAAMMEVSRPAYLMADPKSASKLSEAVEAANHRARLISLDGEIEQSQLCAGVEYIGRYELCDITEAPSVESGPDDLSYIYFTSGTTGVPKAIAGRLKAIDHFIRWEIEELGLDETVRVSQLLPVTFDGSLRDIFVGLCTGGVVCVPQSRDEVKDIRRLIKWLDEQRVSLVHCVPSLMRAMLNEGMKQGELSSLRHVVMAGEALLPADVGRWKAVHGERVELINLYGTTETTMAKFIYRVKEGDERRASIPIGKPIRGAEALLLNRKREPCGAGAVGEIYIRTPYRSLGYYNEPELTEEVFIRNPFSQQEGDIIYRTGDLGRELEGGDYEYLGRRDRQVKIRGVRVELAEIENLLRKQAGIKDVAVIDRQDQGGYNYLCAYLVVEEGVKIEDINRAMEEEASEYQVPSAYVEMEELPRTISGKVDSKRLPRPGESREGMAEYEAASSEEEERVIRMWEEMLGVEGIGVRDNFFRLGGHSLMATQVVSRIREEYGIEIGLREMFEGPTVRELGERIKEARQGGEVVEEGRIERASREGEIGLSYAQQRLWFLDQLEPDSGFYNIAAAVKLTGELDEEALERTFSEMVRRHEVLRTSFGTIEGRPVQVICEAEAFKVEAEDISELEEEEREIQARATVIEEAQRAFDLSAGPLIRVRLIRTGADEHVLVVVMHHIVSDGWSMGVMIREMAVLYEAYREGRESPLEELEIQYADYAVWQREYLQGDVLERQVEYWKHQLEGAPPLLELPTDRPRPAVQSHRGAEQGFAISERVSEGLRELSRREGVTLFMTMLAAFQVLLSKYTGQERIIVGSPIAGRTRVETEELIGFFVNTVVMKGEVRGEERFGEILKEVRETTIGAYANQEVPFEMLVEQMQPERSLSHSPLFQVAFALHQPPKDVPDVTGLSLSQIGVENQTSKFDLTLSLTETRNTMFGLVEYSTCLFDISTISRMTEHFQTLVESIVTNPDHRVSEIRMLSETEQHQLIVEWNDTTRDYPSSLCIHELFQKQVELTPDAVAVIFGKNYLTYAELNRRANQLAGYLRERGAGLEVRVGICVERSVEMIVGLLSILKAGGVYVPLDPHYPKERLSFMLADADIRVLLTQKHLVESLPEHKVGIVCLEEWDKISRYSEENPTSTTTAQDLAYVIYTSGSTGGPKGVCVTHRAVTRLVINTNYIQLDSNDKVGQAANCSFDAATFEIWGALLNGAKLVGVTKEVALSPKEFARHIQQEEITVLFLTTALFNQIARTAPEGFSNLRCLLFGGEAVDPECVREVVLKGKPERLLHVYGPTENTTFSSWEEVEEVDIDARTIPIGKPISNTKIYVLDRGMRPVPKGVAGELCITGDGLARGYWGSPDITAERFVPDPHSDERGGRLYRTGDEVRYWGDGRIEFIGRKDSQVKVRGYRIELGEIETALTSHDGVREAVVVTRTEETGDKRLVGYVVAEKDRAPTVNELKQHLKESLPEYMMPSVIVMLEDMPMTANGKVDRQALPEPEQVRPDMEQGYEAPATATEEILANIWADVLRLEKVGREENFFELGGHSLLATQLISRVRETFEVEIRLRELFERPTVAGLAKSIEIALGAGGEKAAPAIERASRDQEIPLSYAQQRLWFLDQLEPDSVFYNIPAAVKLTGELDEEALERTFSEMVRRHEVLRTSFGTIEGRPVQVICEAEGFKIEIEDISELEEEERERKAERIAVEETQKGFDLSAGPLIRVRLIRTGADEHVLVVVMHHIVSDGWSMGVMIREMAVLYEAYREGKPSPLEELEIQYADYAVWQREYLQGEVLERQVEYWKHQLEGAPPLLELPTDRPRPAVQTYRGSRVAMGLSSELSQGITAVSRAEGVTLFMTMLAAFQALLSRFSGQTDIVVGSPIANRTRAETEPLIGFFVNTLVHRSEVRPHQPFNHLLRQVREASLAAYAHQELPFEMLVEQMQPERSLSHTPLFQVAFTMQNAPREQREVRGLTISAMGAENPTTKFDLTLYVMEARGRIVGEVEYNTDLYDRSSIERMMRSLEVMLEGVVEERGKEVGELAIMREEERRQVIEEWNETKREYERGGSIQEAFERQVDERGDAVAVKYEDQEMSYRELNERANQLAHHLRKLGVGPEVMVGVYVGRGVEIVVAILGILKAGGVFVPIDPAYPQERKAYMMEDAALAVVVSQQGLVEGLPASWAQVVSLDTDREEIQRNSRENPSVEVIGENAAYLIYTSGSTGKPKGVVIEQAGVVNLAGWQGEEFEVRGGSRISQYASYSFDAAVGETMMALLNGGELVMLNREEMSGERLMEEINEEEIDVIVLVPSVIKGMDVRKLRRGKEVRVVAVGEACPVELAEEWSRRSRLINGYGPTEYTVYSHVWEVDEEEVGRRGEVAIGRPIGNTASYILDERMREVVVGVVGEIYIAGAGIGRGYLGRAEETAERFRPNPFKRVAYLEHGEVSIERAREEMAEFKASKQKDESRGKEKGRIRISEEEVMRIVKGLDEDLVEKTHGFISEYCQERAAYEGFCRYLMEGYNHSYSSRGINEDVLMVLLPYKEFDGLKGVDFGIGNGEVIQRLTRMGASMKGLDFNPFFVREARDRGLVAEMVRVDVTEESFLEGANIEKGTQDFVISTLILDRLEKPKNALKNMFAVLKEGGRFAIQTLLPIVGEDDGQVVERTIYTPEENRLTPGKDEEEDKRGLIELVEELGGSEIGVYQLRYIVKSRDGIQEYKLWSIVGSKRGVREERNGKGSNTRMYKTGDLGRYLPDGRIEYRGRIDNQVKIRGFRIEVGEIEALLKRETTIKDCVVEAVVNERGDKELVAYVVTEGTKQPTASEMRGVLKQRVPEYMVPAKYVMLEELPLTGSGKIDRGRLPKPESREREAGGEVARARSEVERMLEGVWEEILGEGEIGVEESFFEIGGHSLLATQVVSRIREMFGVEIGLGMMFEEPTIRGMGEKIEEGLRRGEQRRVPAIERVSREQGLPLSFAQQRLWLAHQLSPEVAAYNVSHAVRLTGHLDVTSLEQSLSEVVRRHETLRTRFSVIEGQPVQIVCAAEPMSLPVTDISFLSESERLAEVRRLAAEETQYLFDLERGPLVRVTLLRLDAQEHIVLFTIHHIICDAWSLDVLSREIALLYEAYSAGLPSPLPDLPIQYADYAYWQRHWLQGEALETELEYWRKQLAGAPTLLELPTDRARIPVQRFRGAREYFDLPENLTGSLRGLSRSGGATIFMVLLAAFQTLLSRYAGRDDIVVGTNIANRNRNDIEGLIGFFINNLVLRTDLSGNPSFRELLGRVRKMCLEAYIHQDLAFEKIVAELRPERESNYSPLFQVMFVFQNAPKHSTKLAGLTLGFVGVENLTARADMMLVMSETAQGLGGAMEYDTDLFDASTIRRLLSNFEILLEGIAANPDDDLKSIPMAPEEESKELIYSFNQPLD